MSHRFTLNPIHVFFALFIVTALASFVVFDVVVRAEYTRHRAEWERDGRPHGFFWVPQEVRGWLSAPTARSSLARARCSLWWAINPPRWAQHDNKVRRVLYGYRLTLCSNLIAFVVFAMSFLRRL